MTVAEKRIGEFACNCTDLVRTGDGGFLVLLVCGDQERYVSRILKLAANFEVLEKVFTIDTWLLAIHFDYERQSTLCSTAGGRILRVAKREYEIAASELPFISGFRSFGTNHIYAFGWHGCILKYDGEWRRQENADKRRIFDFILHNDEMFICGEAGLFSRLQQGVITSLDLPTNARLRRMLSADEALYVTSEAPQLISFEDGTASFYDLSNAPGLDIEAFNEKIYIASGYDGLFSWSEGETAFISDCPAFRIVPFNDELVVMGDSRLTVLRKDVKLQINFEANYKEMLETYQYLPS